MEGAEYDDMMRRMLAIVARMDLAIDELKGFNRQQVGVNERLTAAMEHLEGSVASYMARLDGYMDRMEGYMQRQEGVNTAVSSTLADIKTLLERVVRGSGNGREA